MLTSRLTALPQDARDEEPLLCDLWRGDEGRAGELSHPQEAAALGAWPGWMVLSAAVRVDEILGERPTWARRAETPSVAQALSERARLQPFDLEIARRLVHLQSVCARPRLSLRVEHERLPASRARRVPDRAIADLVSHPGDWEHRTIKSVQPKRVLSLVTEDEWNIYENRVAARLVDHLLKYLGRRVDELNLLSRLLKLGQDYSEQVARVGFRVARRVTTLWGDVFNDETSEMIKENYKWLTGLRDRVLALLDSPLYRHVPRTERVPPALNITNILSNDANYRQTARLWRLWARFGYVRPETREERLARRAREGSAWDGFVLQLVTRALHALGWRVEQEGAAGAEGSWWRLAWRGHGHEGAAPGARTPWRAVEMRVDQEGALTLHAEPGEGAPTLRVLPLCADLSALSAGERAGLLGLLEALDDPHEERLLVWAGEGDLAHEGDARRTQTRLSGWTAGGRAALMALSPWMIDAEERLGRALSSWLGRAALPWALPDSAPQSYPPRCVLGSHEQVLLSEHPLSEQAREPWMQLSASKESAHLVASRPQREEERKRTVRWCNETAAFIDEANEIRRRNRLPVDLGPQQGQARLERFFFSAAEALRGLNLCPLCAAPSDEVIFTPRPSTAVSGEGSTWVAECMSCEAKWSLRRCHQVGCSAPHLTLAPHIGKAEARRGGALGWEDRLLGRDVWALPCPLDADKFSCPSCGRCSCGECDAEEEPRARGGVGGMFSER